MGYARARIGIDIDGVLAKFVPTAIDYAIDKRFLKDPPPGTKEEPYDWGWCDGFPPEFWENFTKDEKWLCLEPYEDNIKELIRLANRNLNKIYIVTSRNDCEEVREQTIKWLENNNVLKNVEDVIFSKEKHKVAFNLSLNYLIDDNYRFLKEVMAAGFCTPILMTRKYNEKFYFPNRVKNLHEFSLRFKL